MWRLTLALLFTATLVLVSTGCPREDPVLPINEMEPTEPVDPIPPPPEAAEPAEPLEPVPPPEEFEEPAMPEGADEDPAFP